MYTTTETKINLNIYMCNFLFIKLLCIILIKCFHFSIEYSLKLNKALPALQLKAPSNSFEESGFKSRYCVT
jgi:hypothetical protein